MKANNIPLTETSSGGFQVVVNSAIYAREAILAACYKYTDKYFVHQQSLSTDENLIKVIFESKDSKIQISEIDVKLFCNELIDQQIRVNVNHEFGYIRDMIVEEAFKPVKKLK